ncbi:MAG: hypothetical protein ACR2KW_00700 [Rubrobacter sp.]
MLKTSRKDTERRLRPSEVEAVLRRSAELNARRWSKLRQEGSTVSSEVVVQVAASAGIPEEDARRALLEISNRKAADPPSYQRTLLGPARVRAVREVEHPAEQTSEYLEELLRREAELKLRYKADGVSVWDPGSSGSVMRRTLDLSADRPLLKTRCVELLVEEADEERCRVDFIADLSNRRAEQASLAILLGITFALMFFLAGIQNPMFFLGVIPALFIPAGGFRLAYTKSRHDTMRVLDALQDAAEAGIPKEFRPTEQRGSRQAGEIQGLKPIPRFVPKNSEEKDQEQPNE